MSKAGKQLIDAAKEPSAIARGREKIEPDDADTIARLRAASPNWNPASKSTIASGSMMLMP